MSTTERLGCRKLCGYKSGLLVQRHADVIRRFFHRPAGFSQTVANG